MCITNECSIFSSDLNIIGYQPKQISLDETHPDWHSQPAHLYRDHNVVLEGVAQAQNLTKTVHIKSFPDRIEELLAKTNITESVDRAMQEAVLTSNVYDAEQKKTAIVKDPLRPAFVLPRNYGITDSRRNQLIISKLIHNCEKLAGRTTTTARKIVNDAYFIVPYQKDGDVIQMEINAETLITSKKAIQPFDDPFETDDSDIPSLFPLKHTITLPPSNIYRNRSVFREFNYHVRCLFLLIS